MKRDTPSRHGTSSLSRLTCPDSTTSRPLGVCSTTVRTSIPEARGIRFVVSVSPDYLTFEFAPLVSERQHFSRDERTE